MTNFFSHEYAAIMNVLAMARDNNDAALMAVTARLIQALRKGTYMSNENRADVLTMREFNAA